MSVKGALGIAAAIAWFLFFVVTRRKMLINLDAVSEVEAARRTRRWARMVTIPLVLLALAEQVQDAIGGSGAWMPRILIAVVAGGLGGWWASAVLAWTTRRDWAARRDAGRTGS